MDMVADPHLLIARTDAPVRTSQGRRLCQIEVGGHICALCHSVKREVGVSPEEEIRMKV